MNKARLSKLVGALAVTVMGLLSTGCGANPAYEPDYPQGYPPPPPPLTSEELAARQQAQIDAQASQEVAVGGEGDEYGDTDPSALTEFRSTLDGHGAWVDDSTYGTVWVPASSEVGTDFQPYVTAGHWSYADDTSWVWVSDYDWGWAPFHYGRWVHLPGHGWSWIPGRRYAGAWVVWRTGPTDYGYIGWAPAPPSWYWYRGTAVGWSFGFYNHHHHYVYCANDYVYHGNVHSYVVRGPSARVHDSRTAEYVPAQPGVGAGGGDRVLANPSVGSPANAGVSPHGGANGRVVAQPGVGNGRVAASPTVARGPRPTDVGIKGDVVVAPPKENPGLQRAQAYGTARSAVERGAAPPAQSRIATAMPSGGAGSATANVGRNHAGGNGRSFAGPMTADGSSRATSVAPLPPRQAAVPNYRDPAGPSQSSAFAGRPSTTPSPTWSPPSYAQPRPNSAGPLPSYRSTPSYSSPAPRVTQSPSFRSSPSVSSSPSFRSSPSVTQSPSFRSSPSVSSSPSFRSSPSVSAPRSSPSFRSSPSVSAPRSSPSFRSSPSVSAPRSSPSFRSSPRVSSPSRGGGGASLGRRR